MIYLDNNATTPIDPLVREAMLPFLGEDFGNPSSPHAPGRIAREAVEKARVQVADLLSARPPEIVFTSGGTESINTAIRGALTAIFWVQAPVYEHTVVPTVREATSWARQRLAADQVLRRG